MLDPSELVSMLRDVPLIVTHGPWIRTINFTRLMRSRQPLWVDPLHRHAGRFSPAGTFPALYLASDEATAHAEVEGTYTHPSPGGALRTRQKIWTYVPVDGAVTGIIDLTDPTIQKALKTNLSELTGVWRVGYPAGVLPPTQVLGTVAHTIEHVRGFRYVSARVPEYGINHVFFLDRLQAGFDTLEVIDPDGTLTQRIP